MQTYISTPLRCIFLILVSLSLKAQKSLIDLSLLSIDSIDALYLQGVGIEEYEIYIQSALKGMEDKTNEELFFKGEVLLAVVADNIAQDIKLKNIDPHEDRVSKILSLMSEYKYHIHQPPVSRVIKIAYYSCQGRYDHLYKRFAHSIYFWPVFGLFLLFIVSLVLQFGGFVKFTTNRILTIRLVSGLVIFFFLFLAFKLTCEKCVSEYSLYGIPF